MSMFNIVLSAVIALMLQAQILLIRYEIKKIREQIERKDRES